MAHEMILAMSELIKVRVLRCPSKSSECQSSGMNEWKLRRNRNTALSYEKLDDDKGREKKRDFLKSIWLHACASYIQKCSS
jgi:hypothetical protein